MRSLYVEQRELASNTSLSWDLAHHLYTRQLLGKVSIVGDDPTKLLASISKQWQKVVRQVQRERSSTLDAAKILKLTQAVIHMQRLRFSVKPLETFPDADVVISTVEQFLVLPPASQTLYVTTTLSTSNLERLASNMKRHGLIVLYQ